MGNSEKERFEDAKKRDKRASSTKATFYYHKITNYCEKVFLPDNLYKVPFQPYRHHYGCLYLQTLLRLIDACQRTNDIPEILEYAYEAIKVDPDFEPAIKALAGMYTEQGNISGAMHLLDEFRSFLKAKLVKELSKGMIALDTI